MHVSMHCSLVARDVYYSCKSVFMLIPETIKRLLTQGNLTEVEGFGTFGLLVLNSFDQLLFILKILFTFVTKQATLIRRSIVLSLSLQQVLPGS